MLTTQSISADWSGKQFYIPLPSSSKAVKIFNAIFVTQTKMTKSVFTKELTFLSYLLNSPVFDGKDKAHRQSKSLDQL